MAFFFLSLIFLIVVLTVIYSLIIGISPMPTTRKVKRELLALLPINIQGVVYELGCGWGTLLRPLAKIYQNSIVGIELSPLPWSFCWLLQKLYPYPNIKLLRQDFMNLSLVDAGLVVCYLYPQAMSILKEKFEKELPKGCCVISNTFAIPGWTPIVVSEVKDLYLTKIYVYTKN